MTVKSVHDARSASLQAITLKILSVATHGGRAALDATTVLATVSDYRMIDLEMELVI
jgi:hypothetical protein